MKKIFIFLFVSCLCVFSTLFVHMRKHSEMATLQMEIAAMHKAYHLLKEENQQLSFQLEAIKDPGFLFEKSKDPRFGHLDYTNKSEMAVVDNTSHPALLMDSAVAVQ